MDKIFSSFVKVTAWPVQKIAFKTKIYYEDKKQQSRAIKGPAIVVSNHTSIWDFATNMFTFFGRNLRCIVADVTGNKNWIMTKLMKWFGNIVISRESKEMSFVDQSVEILKKGGVVEIFPEARLPRENEKHLDLLPFTTSTAYIAYLANVKIIPVYTTGKYFSKGRIKTIIGTPLCVRDVYDERLDEKTNLLNMTQYIKDKILGLKHELEKQEKEV